MKGDPNLLCLNKFLFKSPTNTTRSWAQSLVRKGTKRSIGTQTTEKRKAVRHAKNIISVSGSCKGKSESLLIPVAMLMVLLLCSIYTAQRVSSGIICQPHGDSHNKN